MKNSPYNVMRHNDWDRAPKMPQAAVFVGSALFGGGVLTAAQLGFATMLVNVAVSQVVSWAITALAPKPDFSSFGSQGTLVNAREATAPADFVYGQVRKGGTVVYYHSTGEENKFLHQVIVLAGHEIEEIGDIYINDEVVTWDASTGLVSGDWENKIRIRKHLGDQTTVDADLNAETPVGSSFVGKGIAYLYVRYEYDRDIFASGLPLVTAKIKGKKVYDPRSDTTAYSSNAALCIRDFLVSQYGLNDDAIDDVSFSTAANESDEDIPLSGSGSEKRYAINGIIKSSSPIGKVLGEMSTACAGTLFWGSGYWKLKVGAYSSPVKTLTLDDLRGPITVNTRTSMRDGFNAVTGTFNNSDEDFITMDYPKVISETDAGSFVVGSPYTILEVGTTDFTAIGASSNAVGVTFTATGIGSGTGKASLFLGEDGGEELTLDLPLAFTTSKTAVQRISKMTLFRSREQMSISADFGLEAFNVEVGDIVSFTNERYGFDEKEFEVIGWKFSANQEAGDLRVNLTLQETSAAAFSWNAEEKAIVSNNSVVPNAFAGLEILNLGAFQSGEIQGDGTLVNSITVNWDVADNAFVSHYEVEWKADGDTVYFKTTSSDNSVVISPAVDGTDYDIRVRSVSVRGNKGSYADVSISVGGDSSIPNIPLNLVANAGYRYIGLNWDRPANNTDASTLKDLLGYKIYRNTTNNFSTSTFISQTGANSFTDTGLSDQATLFYWVTAVDFSGNEGSNSAPASTTTLIAPDGDRGAGRWNISVASLPASSGDADTAFQADVGDPVDRDQAWFYTGTESSPTAQSVWIYDSDADAWNEQTEVIDGSLVVSGTITADRFESQSIAGLGMTIGSLSDNPTGERIVISDSKIEVYDSTDTLRVVLGDLS